jgi:hypothetical protein
MGGGGGASSTSETTITNNDTSEYMYRNSATKRGGFKGNIGTTRTDTNLDIGGQEDITRTQKLFRDADFVDLRRDIKTLTDCVLPLFCQDFNDLRSKAETAWTRALNLYPELKAQVDAELDAMKEDTINRICQREAQWARTAGSSLNCIVQSMKTRAEIELARELAGVVSSRLIEFRTHETQAIQAAFEHNLQAKFRPQELAFSQIGALYNVLRGGEVTDVTDRDYSENRDEDQNTLNDLGEFYHEVTDISDNSGNYASELDDVFGASQAVAGTVGG